MPEMGPKGSKRGSNGTKMSAGRRSFWSIGHPNSMGNAGRCYPSNFVAQSLLQDLSKVAQSRLQDLSKVAYRRKTMEKRPQEGSRCHAAANSSLCLVRD